MFQRSKKPGARHEGVEPMKGEAVIRRPRLQRDNQQWMLDLALNMRGRARNFEGDGPEVPKRARNYRMVPKVWREAAEQHEALAKRAQARGANATATAHYDQAIEAYRNAQHPIVFDDHPVKKYLFAKLVEMVDRRAKVAHYPIERIEVPFDGGTTISCLFHVLPDRRRAPVVIHLPGMESTKEAFPKATNNVGLARGFHVLSVDGPGQGNSNLQKIRAVKDNYERAVSAVISCVSRRKEVDPGKIAVYGTSMGSYWALRLASRDHRIAAVVAAVACFNPNSTIFTQCTPSYKQAFMYMAGYVDEKKFDNEVARNMTVRNHVAKIKCPTLLTTGEFDPVCPLEESIEAFEDLKSPKELWIFENQYHAQRGLSNLGGLDNFEYLFDWLHGVLLGKGLAKGHRRIAYIKERGDGPWGRCEWKPTVKPGEAYF